MYTATLYRNPDKAIQQEIIKHQKTGPNLQNVVDRMEDYCHLTPQEAKVLLMTRLLHCDAGKIVILEIA